MATVNVNSWAQFVEAVQVSGDTVVCPQGAVWDMNELAPEGTTIPTITCTKIEGNGTSIKNLRTSSPLSTYSGEQQVIDALHVENFIYTGADDYFFFAGVGYYGSPWNHDIRNCRFSGILPMTVRGFASDNAYSHPYFTSCSFALDMPYTGSNWAFISPKGGIYCRAIIQTPNAQKVAAYGFTFSYIRYDSPAATNIHVDGISANVIDGDLPLVTGITGLPSSAYVSVFNKTSIPNLAESAYMKGVTEAQLKDAAYLASIGFPIGV